MCPATDAPPLPERGLCSHHIVINRLLDMHFPGRWQNLMNGVEGSVRNPSVAAIYYLILIVYTNIEVI